MEEFMEKFRGLSYEKKAGCWILLAVVFAVIGLIFSGFEFDFFIFMEIVAGTILTIAVDYLVAKEFEFIAIEKGYEGRRYFWYSFILGALGYLMVIALPKK